MTSKVQFQICFFKFLQVLAILPFTFDTTNNLHFKSTKLQYIYSIIFTLVLIILTLYCFYCWYFLFWDSFTDDFVRLIGIFSLLCIFLLLYMIILYQKIYRTNYLHKLFSKIVRIGQENDEKYWNNILHFSVLLILFEYIIPHVSIFLSILVRSSKMPLSVKSNSLIVMITDMWTSMSLIPLFISLKVIENSLINLNKRIEAIINYINFNKIIINAVDKIYFINMKYFEILELFKAICDFFKLNILIVLSIQSFGIIRKIYPILYSALYDYKRDKDFKRIQLFTIIELTINIIIFVLLVFYLIRMISRILQVNLETKWILRTIQYNVNNLMLMETVSGFKLSNNCNKLIYFSDCRLKYFH